MECHLIGLKMEAEDFLKENLICDEDASVHTYGSDFDLYQYELKDGRLIKETIQHMEDSNVFLCLIDEEDRKLYEWTDKEISNV
jgi:hypothetical protein